MRFTASQDEGKKTAFSISDRVDLCVTPASRPTNRLILLPPFPPDAERGTVKKSPTPSAAQLSTKLYARAFQLLVSLIFEALDYAPNPLIYWRTRGDSNAWPLPSEGEKRGVSRNTPLHSILK